MRTFGGEVHVSTIYAVNLVIQEDLPDHAKARERVIDCSIEHFVLMVGVTKDRVVTFVESFPATGNFEQETQKNRHNTKQLVEDSSALSAVGNFRRCVDDIANLK